VKIIRLTKGRITLVDDEDFERLSKRSWCFGDNGYAHRRLNKAKKIYMHREIADHLGLVGRIDHVNGRRCDNRRENLRAATHQQNQWNQKVRRSNASGFKGVFWRADRSKWYAHITVDRKSHYLGYYSTAEEAAKAYNRAAEKYFGEFARVNEGV
jgi:hypothetical protein